MKHSEPKARVAFLTTYLERWHHFWFAPIPPHVYAVLRFLFGILGCASLMGLRDLSVFWSLDGLIPHGDLAAKTWLLSHGLGDMGGRLLYFACLGSFAAMAVGFRSGAAVALALAASLIQLSWNPLPLSGAHAFAQSVLFCLIWADCGSVWSVDAWLERRRSGGMLGEVPRYPIAPLRLIRFQVALVYLSTGLWKLHSATWRDGSSLHYVLNNNVFHRFPTLPDGTEWFLTLGSYVTLSWELGFAFLILYAPTRRVALAIGVLLHVGMMTGIEIGPFSLVMLSAYVAFLDPAKVPNLPARIRSWIPGLKHHASNDVAVTPAVSTDQRQTLHQS